MKGYTFWKLQQKAVVFGLAAAFWVPCTGIARPAVGADACVVVLECPNGLKLTAVPDASGKFVLTNVPPGTCRLSVVQPETKAAPPPAASESRLLPTVNKVVDADAPAAKTGVLPAREASSGMATGKRQYQPMVFRITVDDFPAASKTMAMDDWSKTPVSIVVDDTKKTRELTGHVTLIK